MQQAFSRAMPTPPQDVPLVAPGWMKWSGLALAVVGALTAFGATTGRDALVLLVTAAAAAAASGVAVLTGALTVRRKGEPRIWVALLVCLPTWYLLTAALSGWALSRWPSLLMNAAQTCNAVSIAIAGYAIWRQRRLHRLAPATD